jgi:hypothetical protein
MADDLLERANRKCFVLYEGKTVAHRSCGIALAETFGLPTRSYQALRRGGLTGEGYCGALLAGELVLGEILGDPDPRGAVTPVLREAVKVYRDSWKARVGDKLGPDLRCNTLTGRFPAFQSPERASFCTELAAEAARAVAQALVAVGKPPEIGPIPTT